MLTLHPLSPVAIDRFRAAQGELPLSYAPAGMTEGAAPRGFRVDHLREPIGEGPEDFARAAAALESWTMFQLGWVRLHDGGAAPAPDGVVAMVARFGPLV